VQGPSFLTAPTTATTTSNAQTTRNFMIYLQVSSKRF